MALCQFLTAGAEAQSKDIPTTTEVLEKYEQSLVPFQKFTAMRIYHRQWGRILENGKEDMHSPQDWPTELRVDGERVFVKTELTADDKTVFKLEEHIFGTVETFEVQIWKGDRKSISANFSHQKRDETYALYEYLGMLLSHPNANDPRTVAELLAGATDLHLVDSPTEVQGTAMYNLQGKTPFGILTASIGKFDGIARQITFDKHKGDLDDRNMLMGNDDPLFEGDAPIAQTITWSDVKVQAIDGKPIPIGGKLTTRSTYLRHDPNLSIETTELRNINLKPDFTPASFRPDIPEGAQVYSYDDRRTPFVWHNGQVIKRADLRAAVAADAKVPGLVWTDWRVIILACLILLTIPITLVSWYVRRRKPKTA